MKIDTLKGLSLLIIIVGRLILFALPSMGQSPVTIDKFYVLNLIHDAKRLRVCDSLTSGFKKEISIADAQIESLGTQVFIVTEQRDISKSANGVWEYKFSDQKADYKSRIKAHRVRTLKVALIAIGEAVVIVLLIL